MRIAAMLLARRCICLVGMSSSPGGRVVLAIVRSELAVAAHRWLRTVVARESRTIDTCLTGLVFG